MTRGTLILIDEKKVHELGEINGDMFPTSRGAKILLAYINNGLKTIKNMKDCYLEILDGDDEYLDELLNVEECPIKDSFEDFHCSSDYMYVVNNSGKDIVFADPSWGSFVAKNGLLTISYFYDETRYLDRNAPLRIELRGDEITDVEKALDFYYRMFLMQFDRIIDFGRQHDRKAMHEWDFFEPLFLSIRNRLIKENKDVVRNDLHASYGIFNEEVDVRGKLAYEIKKTLTFHKSHALCPEGGNEVNFDRPLPCSGFPLPRNETKLENDEPVSVSLFDACHIAPFFDALEMYGYLCAFDFESVFRFITDDEPSLAIAKTIGKIMRKQCGATKRSNGARYDFLLEKMESQLFAKVDF